MPPVPPPELVRLLQAADPAEQEEAWSAFLRVFTQPVLRVARSLGGGHDAVMDRYAFVLDQLRQDDWRRLRGYDRPGAGEFTLWFMLVVRRLCFDQHRHVYGRARTTDPTDRGAERAARRRLVDLVAADVDPEAVAAPAGEAPDVLLVRAERRRALTAALDALPPRDRLMLRLRFGEELSARQVAEALGFPTPFHVYRRLDVVLRSLRASLERAGVEDAQA
ncbi:MAG TPA: sigma-70 family RNA polymerase sigma factor [Gemmatimonadales bacterium]|nr:sigma-70 family RNA polymerase sigma factor [Gemmatimonadales bacterium]